MVTAEVELPKGRFIREVEVIYEMNEPSVPIQPEAVAVHGLTAEGLRGKKFDLVRIRDAIQKANVLIAHNAAFDRRMLAKVVPEADRWAWRCSWRQVSWPAGLPNNKLDAICQYFEIERLKPHNSLSDARSMAHCLFKPSGKTKRSQSYLASCLKKNDF